MTQNTYFIRDDYKINNFNKTLDRLRAGTEDIYWTEIRIKMSYRYQYDVYKLASKIANKISANSVLDVGCGVATKLNLFFGNSFSVYGVDQKSAIEICQKKYKKGVYLEEDFESPSLKIKKFIQSADLIICADVIEHIYNPDNVLTYLREFSDAQTTIVISTPDREALVGKQAISPGNPYHIREWSSDEFKVYLENFGFEILDHKTLPAFRFQVDKITVKYWIKKLKKGLPIADNQVVICRKK
jgi:2-polyprenyl-3-methyl-5-hydroxy-6-metoxy-1,4-benzoquinol methylase